MADSRWQWRSRPALPALRHRLKHFRRERHDLHEALFAQFARHRAENARALRILAVFVEDHGRVIVKTNVGAVIPAVFLRSAHDHGLDHRALLDRALRGRVLHGGHDHVAHVAIPAFGAAQYADHQQLTGAGVVRDNQAAFILNHAGFPSCWSSGSTIWVPRITISSTTQRLSLLMGRLSIRRTVSPIWQPFSSCALKRRARCTTLPYSW